MVVVVVVTVMVTVVVMVTLVVIVVVVVGGGNGTDDDVTNIYLTYLDGCVMSAINLFVLRDYVHSHHNNSILKKYKISVARRFYK
jgi:hypothetical protein